MSSWLIQWKIIEKKEPLNTVIQLIQAATLLYRRYVQMHLIATDLFIKQCLLTYNASAKHNLILKWFNFHAIKFIDPNYSVWVLKETRDWETYTLYRWAMVKPVFFVIFPNHMPIITNTSRQLLIDKAITPTQQ